MLYKIGTEIRKTRRQGGGSYTVIGHVNCSRCKTINVLKEVTSPTKAHRKARKYYSQFSWCWKCNLYEPNLSSKVIIK